MYRSGDATYWATGNKTLVIGNGPTPGNFSAITGNIKQSVDYIVRYRQDDDSEVSPSAIVKWKAGKVEVLRG